MYIYMNRCKQITDVKFLLLHKILEIIFLCEKKMSTGLFKNIIKKMCLQIIYNQYLYINSIWH